MSLVINFFGDTIELWVNPFYNNVFSDHFFVVTLTNYDLNMYLHFLTSLHFFSFLSTLESYYFFFFSHLDSLLLVCTTWTQSNTNIAQRNYNLQNPNICSTFPPL